MTNKRTGRPPKYTETQVIEGIEIVERNGEVPTGDTVKKAMCDDLGVAGGINAQSLDKEVQRLVEEREQQRLALLISALPSETLNAVKKIGSLVESAVLGHIGEQHEKLRALAGRKLTEQNVDLGNQREQIRSLLSRLDRKDADIEQLEQDNHKTKEQLGLATTEIRALKERIAELEHEEDFRTRMLAMMKETLGENAFPTARNR